MASRAELARRRRKRAKARQRERKAERDQRSTLTRANDSLLRLGRDSFDLVDRVPIQQPAGLGTTPEALPLDGNEAAGLPPGAPGNGMGHSGATARPSGPAPGVSSRAPRPLGRLHSILLLAALGVTLTPGRDR